MTTSLFSAAPSSLDRFQHSSYLAPSPRTWFGDEERAVFVAGSRICQYCTGLESDWAPDREVRAGTKLDPGTTMQYCRMEVVT